MGDVEHTWQETPHWGEKLAISCNPLVKLLANCESWMTDKPSNYDLAVYFTNLGHCCRLFAEGIAGEVEDGGSLQVVGTERLESQ